MSAAVDLPEVRFVVCGGNQRQEELLRREAERYGAAERFELLGFVELLKPVLERLGVFGYPLCTDTYATSEQSLQEAMYAGLPSVVFPHGGLGYLVEHEQTGLVVRTPAEYTAALERLGRRPAERERLGRNAREYARRVFNSAEFGAQF